ncbi:MAG: hypothetical protein ACI8SA_002051 [Dokdonia sp.]|jgi:hypothetical protein
MPYQEVFSQFWEHVKESAEEGRFAKLTLAKTIGKPDLKNIFVRPMASENGIKVLLKLRYQSKETPDIENEFTLAQALEVLKPYLVSAFSTVLLFTTTKDLTFKINKKGVGTITENPPTFANVTLSVKDSE